MLNKPIPELKISDLDSMYKEGEECDKRVFSEMRTNLQLVAGEHYVREGSRFWNRIRDTKHLTHEQRLKLTKNHVQRVTKIYRNSIESYAPGVAVSAAQESELSSQKAAQLNQSVWSYHKKCLDIPAKIAEWVKNFTEIGEVCVKSFWDMDGGQIVGYEAQMGPHPDNPDALAPILDEAGSPKQDPDKPVYGGKWKLETFEAYNLRRDPAARTMKESPYLILSKLVPKNSLRSFFKDDDDIKKFENMPTEEHTIYDNNTGSYVNRVDQILIKEIYFRPAPSIPNGYYFIYTSTDEIASGELPYGHFPIIHAGFDEQTGNPRFHSVIRHIRPAQIEINRCASKIAEHQVTLGDDKAWVQTNTKVSQGAYLPGVRVNHYSGMAPTFQAGRTGDQYFPYLDRQINELYQLANLDEVTQEQQDTADLFSNLYKSFRFRKKFAIYGEKFERFLMEVVSSGLELSRCYMSEQELIPAIGRSEYINIPEFKSTKDISYRIKLEPRSDDIETQFGKQLAINHVLQYVGPNMDKEDIGLMIRQSQFLNEEKAFEKFTSKYDNVVNDILALDRGMPRPPRKYDDHKYVLQMIQGRMGKSDFEFLPGPVQQLYAIKVQAHEQMEAENMQAIQAAEAGFIPSGGYLVACDFYQGDPNDPNRAKRVRIPSESISWLITKLQTQGTEVDQLSQLPSGGMADMARMVTPPGQQPRQMLGAPGGASPVPPSPHGNYSSDSGVAVTGSQLGAPQHA